MQTTPWVLALTCAALCGCTTLQPSFDANFDPARHAIHSKGEPSPAIAKHGTLDTMQISGPWQVGHEGMMTPGLARVSDRDPSGLNDPGHGYLRLSTVLDGTRTLSSEVISEGFPGTGPGYYETRMVVDPEHLTGGCLSFFWIQARDPKGPGLTGAGYGPLEIDIEFLANEAWATHPDQPGYVHYTIHPGNISYRQALPFNPSTGYHRYGFLWAGTKVTYTVDGKPVYTVANAELAHVPQYGGWLMANVWSGPKDWGGPTPAQPLSAVYNRMVYYRDAPKIVTSGAFGLQQ